MKISRRKRIPSPATCTAGHGARSTLGQTESGTEKVARGVPTPRELGVTASVNAGSGKSEG